MVTKLAAPQGGPLRHARRALLRDTAVRKLTLGCGIAASALYIAADIAGALRYPGYSYVDQTVSELSATGAPTRAFMIIANGILYGALVTVFALGVWRYAAPRRFARITAGLLLGHVAIASAWWFFPMDRREVLAAGMETGRSSLHIPIGAVNVAILLLAVGFGRTLLGARFRRYSIGSIAAALVFGSLASMQAAQVAANEPTPLAGIQERVSVYAIVLWFAALVIGLLSTREVPGSRKTKSLLPLAQRLTRNRRKLPA